VPSTPKENSIIIGMSSKAADLVDVSGPNLGDAGGADQCTGVDLVDSRETNLVGVGVGGVTGLGGADLIDIEVAGVVDSGGALGNASGVNTYDDRGALGDVGGVSVVDILDSKMKAFLY
jgi:hypothetical protein